MIDTKSGSSIGDTLELMLKLSIIDEALVRILAEKKKCSADLETAKQQTVQALQHLEQVKQVVGKVKSKFEEEDSWIKIEREKIKSRRKAISTFSGYRVQQNALTEVERTEELISAREDSLLTMLDQVEKGDTILCNAQEKLVKCKTIEQDHQERVKGTTTTLEERYVQKQRERDEISAKLSTESLNLYDNVRSRHPFNPIVPIEGNNCSACFMSLQPQQYVEILQKLKMVRCRGCNRILTTPKETI
jgi:uncharacterized protein